MVVLATVSIVVVDAKTEGRTGRSFVAFTPPFGVAVGACCLFGRVSMAHFNAAVTLDFAMTRHMTKKRLFPYVASEVMRRPGPQESLFVRTIIGSM